VTPSQQRDSLPGAWGPLGAIYLLFLLAGLAAGLWPEAIYPPRHGQRPVLRPALQTVALAQAAFALLVYPLAVLRRAQRDPITPPRPYWRHAAAEVGLFFLVALPFYLVGAFLADAVWTDVLRVAIYLVSLWAFVLAACALLRDRPAWRPLVMLLLVLIALAAPAACYLAMEFIAPMDPGTSRFMAPPAKLAWLWRLSPAMNTWMTAASRSGPWLPSPLWPVLLWLASAALCAAMLPRRPQATQT